MTSVSVPLSGLSFLNAVNIEDCEDIMEGFRPLIGVIISKLDSMEKRGAFVSVPLSGLSFLNQQIKKSNRVASIGFRPLIGVIISKQGDPVHSSTKAGSFRPLIGVIISKLPESEEKGC